MEKLLERLIQQVQDTRLIERLEEAGFTDERVKICEEVAATPEIQELKAMYHEFMDSEYEEDESVLSNSSFTCTKDNAVAVAIIFIIANVDESYILDDYEELTDALQQVEGEHAETADLMARFLYSNCISTYTLEEILESIF